MSRTIFFIRLAAGLILSLSLMNVMACDPCYELGSQLCDCHKSEDERRECKNKLSLAKSHKFFDIARDPQICREALKKCGSCKTIEEGQDQECGLYRTSLKEEK
jgi:hypothetical protein